LDLRHALKAFSELDFDACYERALQADFDGIPFQVLRLPDLIKEKATTAGPKDLGDLEALQRIWEARQS
jgi:predicted nucleotidyltransferase